MIIIRRRESFLSVYALFGCRQELIIVNILLTFAKSNLLLAVDFKQILLKIKHKILGVQNYQNGVNEND